MEKTKYIYGGLAVIIIVVLGIFAFNNNKTETKVAPTKEVTSETPQMHTVQVLETLDTSNYTYIKVSENNADYWIAVTKMDVKKGETLYFAKSMEMLNFHSAELDRTFDKVLFVDGAAKSPGQAKSDFVHPEVPEVQKADVSVAPYPGGKTVKDIFEKRVDLNGKVVTIKGKVEKINVGIMNRNWIHIQDGTKFNDEYDLLITTTETANVGDVITIQGKVAINQDFGAGYSYSVLIENAKILKEDKKS
ncbi:MAG TPA: GW dipeptide domain-containing protein [Ignavibacteriaceae bacterium]|nr:GW dipeptide domain-containing protein [Ignavibacteriaceae bacterium]